MPDCQISTARVSVKIILVRLPLLQTPCVWLIRWEPWWFRYHIGLLRWPRKHPPPFSSSIERKFAMVWPVASTGPIPDKSVSHVRIRRAMSISQKSTVGPSFPRPCGPNHVEILKIIRKSAKNVVSAAIRFELRAGKFSFHWPHVPYGRNRPVSAPRKIRAAQPKSDLSKETNAFFPMRSFLSSLDRLGSDLFAQANSGRVSEDTVSALFILLVRGCCLRPDPLPLEGFVRERRDIERRGRFRRLESGLSLLDLLR